MTKRLLCNQQINFIAESTVSIHVCAWGATSHVWRVDSVQILSGHGLTSVYRIMSGVLSAFLVYSTFFFYRQQSKIKSERRSFFFCLDNQNFNICTVCCVKLTTHELPFVGKFGGVSRFSWSWLQIRASYRIRALGGVTAKRCKLSNFQCRFCSQPPPFGILIGFQYCS